MNLTTQNNRLLSIDLARGLAVFFMIAVHTLEVFVNQDVKNWIFGQIIEFFGGPPAAPVFMTLMGFSFIYSRKSELKPKLLRGFKIFLSGYILNIIQWIIIIWSIAFFGINQSSYYTIILLILTFTFISHFINEFIIFVQNKNKI
jgi:uncharacterized membrane protein